MSELFSFRVLAVDDATARFHARTVHPDQHEVPPTKNFALQLVVELYWRLREGYLQGFDVRLHPRRGALEGLVDDMYGAEIAIDRAEHDALRGSLEAMRAEGVCAVGMRRVGDVPRYHKTRSPDYEAFRQTAEVRVVAVALEDERGNPRADGTAPDAEATVVATYADPVLLAHVRPGVAWDSAVYDFIGW